MTKTEVILDLGSLIVFTYQNYDPTGMSLTMSPYHWKCAALNLTSGPYPTLFDGLKHYAAIRKELMGTGTTELPPPADNVIHVDFVNKRIIK